MLILWDFTRHLQRWKFSNAKRPRSRSGQSEWPSQHFQTHTQDYPAQNQTLVSPHTSLRFCAILHIMCEEVAPQVIWEPGSLHTGQSPLVQVRVKHTGLYIWPLHFIRVLAYRTLRMVFSYWSKSYDWSPGPGQSPGWAKTWISYICMSSLHVPPHTPHRTWPGNLSWHVAYMWHWSYGMISWLRWWLRIFGWK